MKVATPVALCAAGLLSVGVVALFIALDVTLFWKVLAAITIAGGITSMLHETLQ